MVKMTLALTSFLPIILVDMDREENVNGFRISNPSIHQCSALLASLQVCTHNTNQTIILETILFLTDLRGGWNRTDSNEICSTNPILTASIGSTT